MTAVLERADRGLLAALAVAFDGAGVRDRPSKLAYASMFVARPLTSTSELTPDEARELRRYLRRRRGSTNAFAELLQQADARRQDDVAVPPTATCACTDGGRPGQPSPCDPAGVGRYCPPKACYCGGCPWWTPMPDPNYAAAIAKLADQAGGTR